MAKYRPIYIQIWKDPDFQELPPTDKLMFIYLCTNSSTSESGIYPITAKTIANETAIPLASVVQRLHNGLFKNVLYDESNKIVFIRKFKKYNTGGKPELIRRSIVQDCFCTPNSPLWSEFVKEYPEYERDIETVVKGFSNGLASLGKGNNTLTLTNNSNNNSNIEGVVGGKQEIEKKEPSPYAMGTRQVFAGLKVRKGYNSREPKGEAVAIIDMLKEGLTPDEILKGYDIIKVRPYFRDKNLTMMLVRKDIHEVLKKGEGDGKGRTPNPQRRRPLKVIKGNDEVGPEDKAELPRVR